MPRVVDQEARRQLISDALLAVVRRDGVGAVSVRSVAKEAGLSVGSMQRGDLIFWGTHGGSTEHLAIYIGNGKMIEAAPPRGTNSVHATSVYSSYDFVVRPFSA